VVFCSNWVLPCDKNARSIFELPKAARRAKLRDELSRVEYEGCPRISNTPYKSI